MGGADVASPRLRALARSVVRVQGRGAWPFVALNLALVVVALGILAVVIALLGEVAQRQRDQIIGPSGALQVRGMALLALQVGLPAMVAIGLVTVAVIAAIVKVSEDLLGDRRTSLRVALSRGVRRTPSTVGAVLLALGGVAGLAVATPFLMLAGVGGLLLTPLVRLVARRRGTEVRWPEVRTLVVWAIPLAPSIQLAVRWGLLVPAATLERNGPRAALRRSAELVSGRWLLVGTVLLVSVAAFYGIQLGLFALGAALPGSRGGLVLRVVAQTVFSALPLIAVTALFRGLAPQTAPALAIDDRPRPGARSHDVQALALVLAAVLLGTSLVLVGPGAPAQAAAPVAFTVDDLGDEPDADPGDGTCATAGGTCTLRAAVDEANADVRETYRVGFSVSGDVAIASTLVVEVSMEIVGDGQRVAIVGPATDVRLLTFVGGSYSIDGITLTGGRAADGAGGGAIAAAVPGSITNATFVDNAAEGAAGGAIATSSDLLVVNATFSANSADAGGDIASAGDSFRVAFSTFSGSTGGAVLYEGSGFGIVDASIVATSPGCTGVSGGSTNLENGNTCPDAFSEVGSLDGLADNGGPVDTFAIADTSPAVDSATRELPCPPTDARGIDRPQRDGCDIGAFELEGRAAPQLVVDDLGDGSDAAPGDGACGTAGGGCTLRAAVEEVAAIGARGGTISFAVDGTISVASPLELAAEVTIDGEGRTVAIDGGGATKLFRFTGDGVPWTLKQLTLTGGQADGARGEAGGGAIESVGTGTLEAVTLEGNTSTTEPGGAVAVLGGSLSATNVTFSGNAAPAGADLDNRASATLLHVTAADGTSGSLRNEDAVGASLTVANSIVAPASGPACEGTIDAGTGTVVSDASCGTTPTDPKLAPLADNGGRVETRAIGVDSPAVDAADGASCAPVDARNVARPQAFGCDAGAFELELIDTSADLTVDDLGDEGDAAPGDGTCATAGDACTLRAAIDEANAATAASPLSAPTFRIGFSRSGTITVGSTLEVAARVAIDGGTQQVELSGDGAVRILEIADRRFRFALTRLTFRDGQTADAAGGSAVLARASGSIASSTFHDNATTSTDPGAAGGAVAIASGSVSLTNVTFFENRSPSSVAGADLHVRGQAEVNHSTFSRASGGSIYGDDATFATLTIYNSVVQSSDGFNCLGNFVFGRNNLSSDPTCPTSDGFSRGDPQLLDLARSGGVVPTIGFAPTSPLRDAGWIQVCASTDARDLPRTPPCDIGAVEAQPDVVVEVSGSPNPSAFGAPATATATVRGRFDDVAASGEVVFREGATELGRVTLDAAGRAELDLAALPGGPLAIGTRTITADYQGNATTPAASASYDQEVVAPEASVKVTAAPDPGVFGARTTFAAAVSGGTSTIRPTGQVAFTDGGTPIGTAPIDPATGIAELTVDPLALGPHDIEATYQGDDLYAPASGDLSYQVGPTDTTAQLRSSASTTVFGQQVTFTATVRSTSGAIPNGVVTFTDDGRPIGSAPLDAAGVAVLTTGALAVGPHEVVATYPAAPAFRTSAGTIAHQVNKAGATVVISSSASPAAAGQGIVLTATVTANAPGAGTPGGTVSFFEGATFLAARTVGPDGTATLDLGTRPVGSTTITAAYGGDARFEDDTSAFTQVVVRASTSTIGATSGPSVAGELVTLTATVAVLAPGEVDPSGDVAFALGDTLLGEAAVGSDGRASISTRALPVGTSEITLRYSGDGQTAPSTGTVRQTVDRAATDLDLVSSTDASVVGERLTLTATVDVRSPGSGTATGTVTFADGATELGQAPIVDGVATLDAALVATGGRTITATYGGSASFAGSSGTTSVTVAKAASTVALASSANPSVAGQPVTLTATVGVAAPGAATPTGTVTFLDGTDEIGTGTIGPDGTATTTTSSLPVGTRRLTATYAGSAQLLGSTSDALDQEVSVAGSTVALTSSANPSVFGQEVTFTAQVSAATGTPTGEVTFAVGSTPLGTVAVDGTGRARFSTSSLLVGDRQITASYGGDAAVGPGASDPLVQVVARAATTTSVDATPAGPTVAGQPITVTVAVRPVAPGGGVPTGSVQLLDGGAPLGTATLDGSGTATFTLDALAVGPHPLSATYAGSTRHVGSSSSVVDRTVTTAATTTGVTTSGSTRFGQAATFTATVGVVAPGTGPVTGSVTFVAGGVELGSAPVVAGTASITTAALDVGTTRVTATYGGDARLAGSSGGVDQVVAAAATTTDLEVAPASPVVGQTVTLTARVAAVAPGAGTPAGQVSFFDGFTLLGTVALDGAGVASFPVATLAVGPHTLIAAYGGSDRHQTSTDSTATTVGAGATTVALQVPASGTVVGQPARFVATVSPVAPAVGAPSGTVTFRDGATVLGTVALAASPAGSTAELTTSSLPVGSRTISATYDGSASFSGSTTSGSHPVTAASTTTSARTSSASTRFGEPVTLSVTVAPIAPGGGTPTGTVTFADGGAVLGTRSLVDGTATLTTSALAVGDRTVSVTYAGSASHLTSSGTVGVAVARSATTTALVSSAASTVVGQPVTFTATVAPVAPGAGTPTGTVTFADDGTTVATVPLDGSGVARWTTTDLAAGDHPITAAYAGSTDHEPSASTPVDHEVVTAGASVLLEADPLATVFGQTIELTATVTALTGSATPTGEVAFADGARSLGTATLDGSGVATLEVDDLAVGPHELVATYAGDASVGGGASAPVAVTVGKASTETRLTTTPDASVAGQPVALTATVATVAPGSGTPTGTVTFRTGTTVLGQASLDADGRATITTSDLPVATHRLTATFEGDASRTASTSAEREHVVSRAAASVALTTSPNPSVRGAAVTLTATVAAVAPGTRTPTGEVTFSLEGVELGRAALDGTGRARITTSALPVGSLELDATYEGDANTTGASTSRAHEVAKARTTTTLTAPATPIVAGSTTASDVGIAVTGPNDLPVEGVVSITADGQLVAFLGFTGGRTAFDPRGLDPGPHELVATFLGSDDHEGSTSEPLLVIVEAAPTVTTIASTPTSSSVVGQPVELRASVTSPATGTVPAGTVTFRDGSRVLGTSPVSAASPTATLSISDLAAGSRSLTASFVPSGPRFSPSASEPRSFTVLPAATSVALASSAPSSVVGQPVTFTATVSPVAPGGGIPTGEVTFSIPGRTLGVATVGADGRATLVRADLPVATSPVTASYAGTNSYRPASATRDQTVSRAATTVAVTSAKSPIVTGEQVAFTARISVVAPGAATPTGTVTFVNASNGTTYPPVDVRPDGTATLPFSIPFTGGVSISASYSGDALLQGATGFLLQRVDPAATTVTLTGSPSPAVIGDEVVLRAVVAPVAPGGGVPTGTVTFRDFGTVLGTATIFGGDPTVGGVAILRRSADELGRFTHSFTATYTPDAAYLGSTSPTVLLRIDQATPEIDLVVDPPSPLAGASLRLTGYLRWPAGASAPTGGLTFLDGRTVLGFGDLGLVDGRWGVRVTLPGGLPAGTREITVGYNGDGKYRQTETVVPVTVGALSTRAVAFANPAEAGGTASVQVVVQNTSGSFDAQGRFRSPTGQVRLTVGGDVRPLATLAPLSDGSSLSGVLVPTGILTSGDKELVVEYLPTGDFAPSTGTGTLTVVDRPSTLSIVPQQTRAVWGESIFFRSELAYSGSLAPTGTITISDGAGASCSFPAPRGGCQLTWSTPGRRAVTARYGGDAAFGAAASNPVGITIDKRASTITGSVSNARPVTGTSVTVRWQVSGPTSGSVSAQVNRTDCGPTPAPLTGSCQRSFPLELGGGRIPVAVTFPGDDLYLPATYTDVIEPIGCRPLRLVVEPAGAGTAAAFPPPNCGGGTGYLDGTSIAVFATPANDDWKLNRFLPSNSTTDDRFVMGPPSSNIGVRDYTQVFFERQYTCFRVMVYEQFVGPGANGFAQPTTTPNCPVDAAGNRITPGFESAPGAGIGGRYLRGTTVNFSATPAGTFDTLLYGWRRFGGLGPIEQASPSGLTVTEDIDLYAVFGQRCFRPDITSVGAGTITVETGQNCNDQRSTGWYFDTPITVAARPAGDGYVDRWEGAPAGRVFFTGSTSIARNERTTFRVSGLTGQRVTAYFETCRTITIEPIGPGSVTIGTPTNCPNKVGQWWRGGTELWLRAVPDRWATFGSWGKPPVDGDWGSSEYRSIVLDADKVLRPGFATFGQCRPLEISVTPPGWGSIGVTGFQDDKVCENWSLDEPASSASRFGYFSGGWLDASATRTRGNPLLGFRFTAPMGSGYGAPPGAIYGDRASMYVTHGKVELVACQEVVPIVTLISPDGTRTTGRAPTGFDFINADSTPDCPYHGGAWVVGSEVEFAALAPPAGYRFQGWSRDVSGTRFVASTTLDGSRPTTVVEATYQVVCYKLTINRPADVKVGRKPNCPNAPESENLYIGGTQVLLQGKVPGGRVWQGWGGDAERTGKVNPSFVTMTSDKNVQFNHRAKTWQEEAEDFFEDVGDALATTAKKAVGVLALVVGEVLTGAPPMGILSLAVGVATGLDALLGLAGVDIGATEYLTYAQETLEWLTSGFTCAATWAFNGARENNGLDNVADIAGDSARDAAYRDSDLRETYRDIEELEASRSYDVYTTGSRGINQIDSVTETTDSVTLAKLKYKRLKASYASTAAPVVDAAGNAIGVGLAIYDIVENGPGFGWDSDAATAWTDGTEWWRCLDAAMPSYFGLPTLDPEYYPS